MPIYEYRCEKCEQDFELLIRGEEQAACPKCGGKKLQKQFSVFASQSSSSSSLPICPPPAHGGGCGLPQCGTGGCQFGE